MNFLYQPLCGTWTSDTVQFSLMTTRPSSSFSTSLHASGAPKLTKEQLAKRRSEVIKYYNELSRRKSSSQKVPEPRPKTSPPPPPVKPAPPSMSRRSSDSRKIQKPSLKPVPENPNAETWEQIKELTEKLLEQRPILEISRGDVEGHVENVRKLVGR